jgi:TP901 family phage tail tape measure protein
MLLAQMVVEYVADTSKLVAGVAAASAAMDSTGASAAAADGYLASLGEQVFTTGVGFDGLASSAATASEALAGTDASLAGVDASLATTSGAAGETAVALDTVAASEDKVAASAMTAKEAASAIGTAFLAVTAVTALVGVATTKMAGDFESGITTLETGAGELHQNIGMVRDGILTLGPAVGETTKQLVDGMFEIESSGQHGAAALDTLKMSAEGAKVGNADLGVTANAVTTEMTDYASMNLTAAQATNTLIAEVSQGKTHMQDLAQSLSTVLPTASAAGISLTDVSGAMSTMTGEGVPAADAATYLRQTIMGIENPSKKAASEMKAMGLSASGLADEMKVSLPGALQMITDAVGKKFPVGSQQYIASVANIVGGTKSMQGILDLTGTHMQTFKDNVSTIGNAVKQGGNSIVGWSKVQGDFNQKMSEAGATLETVGIKIDTALLPVADRMLDGFQSLVVVGGHVISFFQQNHAALTTLQGVLIPAAGAIGGLLVFALVQATIAAWGAAAGFIALTWPFLAIGAAIALLGVGIFLLAQHWNQLVAAIPTPILNTLHAVFQQIGAFLTSIFVPIWQQLVATWQGQLLPALMQLWTSVQKLWVTLQPLIPVLQVIGAVIGGVVVVALGIFVATIGGLAKGIASMLPGIIQAFGGIVQIISGDIQIIIGIIAFFIDLFTGKWSKLGGDLGAIWQGVVSVFSGVWNVVAGIFNAGVGLIVGYVTGFFQTLNALTGGALAHLWGGITSWFGSIGAFFVGVWNGIISFLKAAWDIIVNVVKIGALVVLAVILAPFLIIGGLFIWLYQHNIYFQRLVDAIVGFVRTGVAWLVEAWQVTIAWIVGAWQGLVGFATSLWNQISTAIRIGFFAAIAFVVAIWNDISSHFVNAWNLYIAGPLTSLWQTVSTFFSGIWNNYIAGPIGSLWTSISTTIGGWVDKAVEWGRNLIQGFVNGIISKANSVAGAVGGIAGQVLAFLGFHSPTKEGPGREADDWAPSFIDMFASGLESGIPKIQAAMSGLVAPVALSMQGANVTPIQTSAKSSGGNSTPQEIHVHNYHYWDGQDVTDRVMTRVLKQSRKGPIR